MSSPMAISMRENMLPVNSTGKVPLNQQMEILLKVERIFEHLYSSIHSFIYLYRYNDDISHHLHTPLSLFFYFNNLQVISRMIVITAKGNSSMPRMGIAMKESLKW